MLIFKLVFELERRYTKFVNVLTNILTKQLIYFFDVHRVGLFYRTKDNAFRSIFVWKLFQPFLRYFEKTKQKNDLHCTITLLAHTQYSNVKTILKCLLKNQDPLKSSLPRDRFQYFPPCFALDKVKNPYKDEPISYHNDVSGLTTIRLKMVMIKILEIYYGIIFSLISSLPIGK